MNNFSDFKCEYRHLSEIRNKADAFRNTYWDGKPLPVDMERLIEQHIGLEIKPESGIRERSNTDAFLQCDLRAIIVDLEYYMDDRYSSRLRFSFAYEIGHYVLHRNIYEKHSFSSKEEFILFIKEIPEKRIFLF